MSTGNETTWTNEIALKTRLRVEPSGQPAFEWRGRLRYRESHTPVADDRVWVLFDADDHESLMVDFSAREGAWDGVGSAGAGATIFDPPGGSAAPAPRDRLDQLEKLGDLRDRGILTPDEFEAQKRQLLGEPPA
ncbi:MAG: Short C-terminal domain [Thermoleophilaceae bacterium]|nr:Short C-terminal domain [Thermoleophilaceae bacterium]